jgi:hypothetical protein
LRASRRMATVTALAAFETPCCARLLRTRS